MESYQRPLYGPGFDLGDTIYKVDLDNFLSLFSVAKTEYPKLENWCQTNQPTKIKTTNKTLILANVFEARS